MNTETDRLINGIQFINGAINSRILKDSQEYYALAVIKSLFPDDYKTLVKKETDRPDLKNIDDLYGVEVTTADSKIDNEDNRLFDIYGKDKKKKIKDKLEKHGKKISETKNVIIISHATTIKCFLLVWFNYSPYMWYKNEPIPSNCSIRLINNSHDYGYIYEP